MEEKNEKVVPRPSQCDVFASRLGKVKKREFENTGRGEWSNGVVQCVTRNVLLDTTSIRWF